MRDKFHLDIVRVQLIKDRELFSDRPIKCPQDAIDTAGNMMRFLDREMMAVLNLKSNGQILNMNVVGIGDVQTCITSPREMFKSAILSNAASIILMHNHPSGAITPSPPDIAVTKQLIACGQLLGIPVLDHIIVGAEHGRMYSMKEEQTVSGFGEQAAYQIGERKEHEMLSFFMEKLTR